MASNKEVPLIPIAHKQLSDLIKVLKLHFPCLIIRTLGKCDNFLKKLTILELCIIHSYIRINSELSILNLPILFNYSKYNNYDTANYDSANNKYDTSKTTLLEKKTQNESSCKTECNNKADCHGYRFKHKT